MVVQDLGPSSFNPRLRLDLSSGQGSLRSLRESTEKLHGKGRQTPPPDSSFASLPPAVDYEKAISLMRGRHTHDMHERHVGSLRKIAAANVRGFFLQDVAAGAELLRLGAERLSAGLQEYEGALCELLTSLSVPFQKSRSNDDIRFEADVLSLVRQAADLAVSSTTSPVLASFALEMVLALAVPPPPPASSAEAMAREAMTLGPRIEALKVLKEVIKAGAVASISASAGAVVNPVTAGGTLLVADKHAPTEPVLASTHPAARPQSDRWTARRGAARTQGARSTVRGVECGGGEPGEALKNQGLSLVLYMPGAFGRSDASWHRTGIKGVP